MGDGNKIRYWEDWWFGTSPLSIQFWDLYCICREQGNAVSQVWALKLTFRRSFSPALMNLWYELEAIVGNKTHTGDFDSLVWQYTSSGDFGSLYAIINYRGITPVFILAVWKIIVPPRIHIFLWLFSSNKIMARDNLKKRNMNKPVECVFCAEHGSVQHLFFDCLVAKLVWQEVSSSPSRQVGTSVESVTSLWIAGKKLDSLNTIVASVLWALWKHRNSIIFNGGIWMSLNQIWSLVLRTIRKWRLIFKEHMLVQIDQFWLRLQHLLGRPAQLEWG